MLGSFLSAKGILQLCKTMEQIVAPTLKLNNGRTFPVLGLGTFKSQPGEVEKAVQEAIEAGYRHIDCAMLYQNEREIGVALKEVLEQGKVTREELFITSKLWSTSNRPELVEGSCRKTVSDLGLEYIDLYLIHWPASLKPGDDLMPQDPEGNLVSDDVDIVDTYKAMEKCVELGLTRSIGLSNFNSEQITRILEAATIKPVVNQVECHPYLQQRKLIKFCSEHGMVLTAYCPLGAPTRITPGRKALFKDETINALAVKYNKTVAQIILKFLVQIGTVPIPKTVTKHRLQENINIFDFELSPGDMASVEKLDCNDRIVSFDGAQNNKDYPFNAEF